jgi:hypothetical protein
MKPLEHLANVSRQRLARRILQVMAERTRSSSRPKSVFARSKRDAAGRLDTARAGLAHREVVSQ